MIDPATIGTSASTASIIAKITELLNRLRKHSANKEVYDMVRDLQAEQSKLETKIRDAETEVTRLDGLITDLKRDHIADIAKLKTEHDDKIKAMTADPGPRDS